MKYVRGYLVAGIFAAFSYILSLLGQRLSTLIDMVYPFLTRSFQMMLADWTGNVSFLLWQVLAVVLVVLGLTSIVLMIIFKWNPIQWLGWVLAVVSIGFFAHTCMYGLNYYAGPLSDDIRLQMTEYTVSELADATEYYRDRANDLSGKISRTPDGAPDYPSFEALAAQAGEGVQTLTYRDSDSVFAGSILPVKKLGWADMYTSMGITGFTMPLTGEAAVNPQIPVVSLPFTMCHEMAHRMCIASEEDANFAGFLASRANSSVDFQYSAYFMAYKYCYAALVEVGGTDASNAAARIRADESELLRRDLTAYNDFFTANMDEKATEVATTVNDSYLKTSGEEKGVLSYGDVADYLVCWHLQEVIAPAHAEEENKFDPFDETQVDLSGLPYTPETTEEESGE